MQSALKFTTAILPGRRIEISSPELPEKGEVELIVVLPEATETEGPRKSTETVLSFLKSLPSRPYTREEWEKVEEDLQAGRNSWDR
jgi:hypothetical protein